MSNILGNMPPVFGSGYRGVVPAPSAADVSAQNILRADGTWGAGPSGTLPSQTGNGGKLLTTDGTNASWASSLNTFQFGDVTLGTSGPSVKSTLSARAPRQGLVFDGTAGATVSVPALGTADYTFAIWINPTSLSTAEKRLLGSDGVGAFEVQIDRGTAGNIAVIKSNSSVVTTTGALLSAGKLQLVTITRTSTSGVISINGVQAATFTDSQNYTAVSDKIGSILSPASYYNGTLIGPLVYNRALSASEVVALYEAGAPSGADYNSASNTLLNTSTALNAYSTSFTTFTAASATGFTASDATASKSPRVIFPLSGTLVAGRRYRAKFTATLTAMSSVNLYQSDSSYTGLGNLGAVSSGANEFTFTATSSVNAMMLICTTDGSVGTHSVVISGMAVDTPGLLLAPDAAQAGGGLTWNDTSGNGAHIVLPATGVDFNLPSYGQRIVSAKTSTNGNEKLLGANSLGSVNGRGRDNLVRAYARARTGTPTVTLGWSSGNAGIVASVTLSGGGNGANTWQPLTLITTYSTGVGAAALWAGSNSTDIVDWMIVSDFTPQY